MKIKISTPPDLSGGKYDAEKLTAWLYQLTLAINLGFANISYDNLNDELKADLERVMKNSEIHD